jgi:excisionase family DNA binding protein
MAGKGRPATHPGITHCPTHPPWAAPRTPQPATQRESAGAAVLIVMRTLRMQDDQWLRPREASWHLGVTVTTLAQWARAGRLPAAHTPGGHRRYGLADVQTLQAEREKEEREPQK